MASSDRLLENARCDPAVTRQRLDAPTRLTGHARAVACRDVEAATLALTGLPRLPEPPFRRAAPTTPADRAGARVDCFPARAAFPKWQEGRHPHCHFRGLLRLHSRCGPPDCSAAHRRPLSRGSSPASYPAEPLVSYRINRQLSGWILPPLVIRAFGAHCHFRTRAPHKNRGDFPTRLNQLGQRQPRGENIILIVSDEAHDRTTADSVKPSSENRHTTMRSGQMVARGVIGRGRARVVDIGDPEYE
jgi:hypothetical protein